MSTVILVIKQSKKSNYAGISKCILPFVDSFDMAFLLTLDLENIMSVLLPVLMYTNNLPFLHIMTKANYTTGRRWIIDNNCVKVAYVKRKIRDVMLTRSEYTFVDAFTKLKRQPFS